MSIPTTRQDGATRSPWWPRSSVGRATLVVAALGGVYVALALFALPMIGEAVHVRLLPDVLGSWASPLVLVVLAGLTAALGLVAWRRGEESVLVRVVALLALVGGTLLAADVVLEALVGR